MFVASAAAALAACVLLMAAQSAYANSGTITANGAAVTAIVSSPNVAAKFTFSGTAGEVVTASASAGTFSGSCDASIEILNPTNSVLTGPVCAGQSGFIGETVLPGSGTYTLELAPNNSDTGHVTLALSANPANAAITANGAAVTFTAAHTGQGRDYTFTATAGEVVTASASAGTFPGNCDEDLQIVSVSTGSPITGPVCAGQTGSLKNITLPATGGFILDIVPTGDNAGANVGHVTLQLTTGTTGAPRIGHTAILR